MNEEHEWYGIKDENGVTVRFIKCTKEFAERMNKEGDE